MNVDFTDLEIELELLAQSTVDVTPQHHLRELEYTYVDAPIHELFDLEPIRKPGICERLIGSEFWSQRADVLHRDRPQIPTAR